MFKLTGPFACELGHIITRYDFLEARIMTEQMDSIFMAIPSDIEKKLSDSNPDAKKIVRSHPDKCGRIFVFPISNPVHL